MSQNLNSLVQNIVQQRSAKLPEVSAKLEQLEKLEQAISDLKILQSNPDFVAETASLPFEKTTEKIRRAKRSLDLAKQRLTRQNISIAIAGKARQGKSQMLQMLTGLTDEQIPTGDTTFCTAARSRIINTTGQKQAIVHFFTESEFLDKKVLPAYKNDGERGALGLSPRPGSLRDFLNSPLPALMEETPSRRQFYEDLQKLHEDMQSPELQSLLGTGEQAVDFNHLRPYVTKDRDEDKKYFHVVDFVEIRTPFEVGLPVGMEVFDLPGLGEMTANIRENMLKAITEDADIVMLMRKPITGGDGWREDDFETFDMLKEVFREEDIQPSQWVSLILNQDIRPSNNNVKNVATMVPSVPNGFEPIVCNCGSKDDVRQKVCENMNKLLDNAGRIDSIRIRRAEKEFAEALEICKEFLGKIETAKGKIVGANSGFDFDGHFKRFMADLRGPFKQDSKELLAPLEKDIQSKLTEYFKQVYIKMEEFYEVIPNKTELLPEFPIFTPSDLLCDFKRARGSDEVVDSAIRNQLWAIVELLRIEMSVACKVIKDMYMKKIVELVVTGNPTITNIVQNSGKDTNQSPEQILSVVIDFIRRDDTDISSALQSILDLEITYEEHILPLFYTIDAIDDFDPYSNSTSSSLGDLKTYIRTLGADFENQKNVLFTWLKGRTEAILAIPLQKGEKGACTVISQNVHRIFVANYRNFVNQFIWGETVEKGWKRFALNNQATLWKEEFDSATSKSAFGKNLNAKIATLRSAIQM